MAMDEMIGKYYAAGDKLYASSKFSHRLFEQGYSVFEVIRIIRGNILFVEEHLERLFESVRLSGLKIAIDRVSIAETLAGLVSACQLSEGNIKVVVNFPETGQPATYAYFIPHAYPSQDDYNHGVKTTLIRSVRHDPNIKRLATQVKAVPAGPVNMQIYEHLLVDPQDRITEGSKSNIFFITGNSIYTAPDKLVLKGITRQKILNTLKSLDYTLIKSAVSIKDLNAMETVFLTGTSPKVLPVLSIGTLSFDVDHPVLRLIMQAYDRMIEDYLSE